jgi:hypothetical protein
MPPELVELIRDAYRTVVVHNTVRCRVFEYRGRKYVGTRRFVQVLRKKLGQTIPQLTTMSDTTLAAYVSHILLESGIKRVWPRRTAATPSATARELTITRVPGVTNLYFRTAGGRTYFYQEVTS